MNSELPLVLSSISVPDISRVGLDDDRFKRVEPLLKECLTNCDVTQISPSDIQTIADVVLTDEGFNIDNIRKLVKDPHYFDAIFSILKGL